MTQRVYGFVLARLPAPRFQGEEKLLLVKADDNDEAKTKMKNSASAYGLNLREWAIKGYTYVALNPLEMNPDPETLTPKQKNIRSYLYDLRLARDRFCEGKEKAVLNAIIKRIEKNKYE